ncbi:MAG: ATP-binding protein [Ruminococcus sp.]|nr:ATP-binding protein [Ruminococcus sp.]
MAEVIMMCGRICSGKSTYAKKLSREKNAVILSVDEITLALFPEGAGEMLDTYVERAEQLLYRKSLEIVSLGINVILDLGFWTASQRQFARRFYRENHIDCQLHFLDISEEVWQRRIAERNKLVTEGKVSAYYVDKGLAEKFAGIFESPSEDEIDKRIIIR